MSWTFSLDMMMIIVAKILLSLKITSGSINWFASEVQNKHYDHREVRLTHLRGFDHSPPSTGPLSASPDRSHLDLLLCTPHDTPLSCRHAVIKTVNLVINCVLCILLDFYLFLQLSRQDEEQHLQKGQTWDETFNIQWQIDISEM